MMHSLSKRMRNNPVFWYALFSAENVSISVINRGGEPHFVFVFQESPTLSISCIPVSFIPFALPSPSLSASTKLARRIYLVICIPLKRPHQPASHNGGVRFDVISDDAKGTPAIQSS